MKTVAGDVRELIALTAEQSADKMVSAREKTRAALGRIEEKIAAAQGAAAEKARIARLIRQLPYCTGADPAY